MKNYYIGNGRYALVMSPIEAGRLSVLFQCAAEERTPTAHSLVDFAAKGFSLLTAKSEPTACLTPDEVELDDGN